MTIASVAKQGFHQIQYIATAIAQTIQDKLTFFIQFFRDMVHIGAPCPTGPWACQKMARKVTKFDSNKSPGEGRTILEIGSGPGNITEFIIPKLGPRDHLDVVEYDKKLAALTQKMVDKTPHEGTIKVHHVAIEFFNAQGKKYDVIISALPINNFKISLIKKIYKKIDEELLKEGGSFTYIELMGTTIRLFITRIFNNAAYKKFVKVLKIKQDYLEQNENVEIDTVLFNIPPAHVTHMRKKTQRSAQKQSALDSLG